MLAETTKFNTKNVPAPSILPRNFCDVQSPAKVKLGIGVRWDGLYLFLPGMAAYTDRGVFTTAYFKSLALDPSAAIYT